MNIEITIGSDPEVFLKDPVTDEYIPSPGVIRGSKESPAACNGGAVLSDNAMAEFCTEPALSADEFAYNTKRVFDQLDSMAQDFGLVTVIAAHAKFNKGSMDSPYLQEFGCDPDFNIWTTKQNRVKADELLRDDIRVAGGHVHIGICDKDTGGCPMDEDENLLPRLIRMCDLLLGVPSIMMAQDTVRKKYYGRAGSYRPKPYGAEYRVLNNFWLSSTERMEWVFTNAKRAALIAMDESEYYHMFNKAQEAATSMVTSIPKLINQQNPLEAALFMQAAELPLPSESLL